MKLFQVPDTKLQVLFRTRGEHRPPHVHVENREVPWEARVRFSFVENGDFEVIDIDPDTNEPSAAVIRNVLRVLSARIDFLRRKWWDTFGTVCLDGKWVRDLTRVDGMPQFEVLRGARKDASRARRVAFDPKTGKLTFTLADGGTFEGDAGQGRDLSDKD